jgi:hypothetical protein
VIVYSVVAPGETEVEPFADTVPMPLSIEIVVALVTVHASVEEEPATMSVGVAVKLMLGRLLTVTVAWLISVPPGPTAVSVYVVVATGLTVVEPDSGLLPTPLSMVTDVAFVVFQTSVEV